MKKVKLIVLISFVLTILVSCGNPRIQNYEELLAQGEITTMIGCNAEDFYSKVNDGLIKDLGVDGFYTWDDPERNEIYAVGTSDSQLKVMGYTPGDSLEKAVKELLTDGWEYAGALCRYSTDVDGKGYILNSVLFDKEGKEVMFSMNDSDDEIYSIEYVDIDKEKKLEKDVYGEVSDEPAFMVMTRKTEDTKE